ncbi:hypothetical protein LWI29_035880 [Acer saccharum]|uniref:Uncharacterized protein n=1 Tax=Acer saccharum TaxID=4024 RepID=A0AA39RDS9_ACESA|nr:hypothetical protein LWI29_025383 [Acer saccharum]KAK0572706.1 hypothetical protein LWI29_035880 [Acer saccharum]
MGLEGKFAAGLVKFSSMSFYEFLYQSIMNLEKSRLLSSLMSFYDCELLLKVLAPVPVGLAVFVVHLATIPITGTGINPATSLASTVVWRHTAAWRV